VLPFLLLGCRSDLPRKLMLVVFTIGHFGFAGRAGVYSTCVAGCRPQHIGNPAEHSNWHVSHSSMSQHLATSWMPRLHFVHWVAATTGS
jgi:hypothetical protein